MERHPVFGDLERYYRRTVTLGGSAFGDDAQGDVIANVSRTWRVRRFPTGWSATASTTSSMAIGEQRHAPWRRRQRHARRRSRGRHPRRWCRLRSCYLFRQRRGGGDSELWPQAPRRGGLAYGDTLTLDRGRQSAPSTPTPLIEKRRRRHPLRGGTDDDRLQLVPRATTRPRRRRGQHPRRRDGTDHHDYFNSSVGVTVNLARRHRAATATATSDTLTSIEFVNGSAHADTLTGSTVA